MINERKVDDYLEEKLKDPYFKELWELEQQKLEAIRPIIDYRIKHDLTQTDLAKQIGVTQQHISNIENGIFSDLMTVNRVLLFIGHKVVLKTFSLSKAKRIRVVKSMRRFTGTRARRKRPLAAKRK